MVVRETRADLNLHKITNLHDSDAATKITNSSVMDSISKFDFSNDKRNRPFENQRASFVQATHA